MFFFKIPYLYADKFASENIITDINSEFGLEIMGHPLYPSFFCLTFAICFIWVHGYRELFINVDIHEHSSR